MGTVVGIDLGTTNSVVAVMEGGRPVTISNREGFRTTPSVVAYTKKGECLVGRVAKRQASINPDNTFSSVKRFIGNSYEAVKEEVRQISYQVSRDNYGRPKMQCPILRQKLSPENISAQVLRKLVGDAEDYIGGPVTQAIITVPAYFNDSQRQATQNAGRLAGLSVLMIINEPTAAALAYGLDQIETETVVVFDLGGGTLDVSILEIGDGVFEVLATSGDSHLGGDDFTAKIVNYLASEFYRQEGVSLWQDRQAYQRVCEAAEQAKIDLSTLSEANINLPFLSVTDTGPPHLIASLARSDFNELSNDLVKRCRRPVERALRDAKLKQGDVDRVILVGGSTRIPAVRTMLRSFFDCPLDCSVSPDEAVALGAAVKAGVMAGVVKDILLLDVTPMSLGVETLGEVMTKIIPRNTTVPTRKTETFSTAADGQTNVDIHILQGEMEHASDNISLGRFRLDGIASAPKGTPKVEVTFDIDANGVFSVSATDQDSGKRLGITIEGLVINKLQPLVKESLASRVTSLEFAVADLQPAERVKAKERIATVRTNIEALEVDDSNRSTDVEKTQKKPNQLKDIKRNIDDITEIVGSSTKAFKVAIGLGEQLATAIAVIGTAWFGE